MSRRGSNIYKRKDGRFEGRVPIGHKEDGSLKYKFVYARTLSEVKEKMAQFQVVLQSQPVSALKLTVAEASRQWLSAAKLRVKPSSYAHYENIIRNHILSGLGTKYLTDITTHQLNDFVYEKLQSGRLCGTGGLSVRFVQDIMRVYHSIEQYAVQEYHIQGTHFTMPKAEKKQLDVLSSEERKKLEQYLLQTGSARSLINTAGFHLAILLCLFTGLRVGELCGLQWNDIDFENGTLSVKRTVQRVYRNGSSEVLIGSPKSRTSVRIIPVPSFLLAIRYSLTARAAARAPVPSAQWPQPCPGAPSFKGSLCGSAAFWLKEDRASYSPRIPMTGFPVP